LGMVGVMGDDAPSTNQSVEFIYRLG